MKNILFKTDSSSKIGLGHIMRDLVLAQHFTNANITFAVQDLKGNINSKILENDYSLEILKSNSKEELVKLIKKLKINLLIIDHYEIDYEYEKYIKDITGVTILVLDDTYEKHYCDILLNHNISADEKRYKNLVPPDCELRCGREYTLLRDEFIVEKHKQKKPSLHVKNIFIAMGGADHSNQNINILKVLEKFDNIHAHVVTTSANQHLNQLQEYVKDRDNVTLHVNSSEIAKLMHQADFAIATPSVTINEIIYMELPFIAIKTAENQRDIYEYLQKNNYLCLKKYEEKKFKKILELFHIKFLNFTTLSLNEKKIVLSWRNNSKIQKWMFQQDDIELSAHLQYIDLLKTSKEKLYFMIKKENIYIGVIDFTAINFKMQSAKIGIYANPKLTRIGNILMDSILYYGFYILKLKKLSSEVFQDNLTAIKLYRRYSFKETSKCFSNQKNIITMELNYENSQF